MTKQKQKSKKEKHLESGSGIGWMPKDEKEDQLARLGYQEATKRLKNEKDMIVLSSLASFRLLEFCKVSPGESDPRSHPNTIIAGEYTSLMRKYGFVLVEIGEYNLPSTEMLSFFSGFEFACRVLYHSRVTETRKTLEQAHAKRKKKKQEEKKRAAKHPKMRSKKR